VADNCRLPDFRYPAYLYSGYAGRPRRLLV